MSFLNFLKSIPAALRISLPRQRGSTPPTCMTLLGCADLRQFLYLLDMSGYEAG